MGTTPPITTNNPQNTRSTKPDQASQTFTDMPRRVRIQDVIRSELPPEFLKQDIQLLQSFLLCAPPTTRSSGNTRFLPQAVCFTRSTSSRIVHVHDRVQYLDRMIFIIHLDCTEAD